MTSPRSISPTGDLPLLGDLRPEQPLFVGAEPDGVQIITRGAFLAQAMRLSRTLPPAEHLINLCDDRYLFALAFAAALIRGAVSLFPPNRLAATCHDIAADHPGTACITDIPVDGLTLPTLSLEGSPSAVAGDPPEMPQIGADRLAFIAFTSGSTARPRPEPKHWGDLVGCARSAARRFGFAPGTGIVATVPPQHMYGLELSILVPMITGASIDRARPFFPADIQAAMARTPGARVVVTTPVHLRACADAGLRWPAVDRVISATAPLPLPLAERIESLWSTRVSEIYGTTESGSIASRETCRDPLWRCYDGVRATRDGEQVSVGGDFIHGEVPLSDVLAFEPDGRFRLLGRSAEMVKVAGKRASLAELNQKLSAIDGVEDGVFVAPDPDGDQVGRLAVVAVAPGLDRKAIVAGLAGRIDPVFHPRRVVLVDRLPRNEAGKLPRQGLLDLLADADPPLPARESAMRVETIRMPVDDPSFAGHFPGRPLVPGSRLLELILAAWDAPVVRVSSAKLMRPVLPADVLTVRFTPVADSGAVRFSCGRGEEVVCRGAFVAEEIRDSLKFERGSLLGPWRAAAVESGRGHIGALESSSTGCLRFPGSQTNHADWRIFRMADWSKQRERGSRGALRLILWIALALGRTPARALLYPITAYFLLKAAPQRRASRAFLTRVLGRRAGLWDLARHIHGFAATILDRVFLLAGRRGHLDIRLHHPELVLERVHAQAPFLLLGSHLGSFECLRALAIDEAHIPLKILMYPAHNQAVTEVLHALNPQVAASVISLAGPQPLLEVKESLDAGFAVGLLGDRFRPAEPTVSCDFLGDRARFPTGPMGLAGVTGVPVVLFFGLYRGGNRYDVHFELLAQRVDLGPRAGRQAVLQDWVQRYADRLAHYTRSAPFNWFNFYDFWDEGESL